MSLSLFHVVHIRITFFFFLFKFHFILFWPHCTACGILVTWPGIEPGPLAGKAWSPNRRTTREFPESPFKKYLFIYGCVGSLLLCAGFLLRWLLLLQSTGCRRAGFSNCGTWALERRLSSCGARAELPRGMWDLTGPGLEPVSPALAGGFLTTATREVPGITFLMPNNIPLYAAFCWSIHPSKDIGEHGCPNISSSPCFQFFWIIYSEVE